MTKAFAFLIVLYLSLPYAMGEYRVYQYYVRSKIDKAQEQKAYLVKSALDPVSYMAYHGGGASIELDLVRTWICPGDTSGHRPLCKSPYEKVLQAVRIEGGANADNNQAAPQGEP